jgi:hypothetical protein
MASVVGGNIDTNANALEDYEPAFGLGGGEVLHGRHVDRRGAIGQAPRRP